uniref:Cytidylate kinase-like family protein n=1 Tax=Desulfobacca acetoxidans TaxID=60893 RepID=A0A7V4G6U1_9BACT
MAILTISREYGAGGRDIGRLVAERLHYEYVDKEKLFRDLDAAGGRWGRVAREVDEVCPTLWERHDWQYRGYVARLEALILEYAARDRVVLIGRGSNILLKDVPFCLKVRLVAPLEVRIERIMVRDSLDREAAARLIHQVDHERQCYITATYGRTWEDEKLYDLILNTGTLTFAGTADLLIRELQQKDALATPEARAHLQDLALAATLKAKLATDPRLFIPTLEVHWEGDTLVVAGIIHTPKEKLLVEELSRQAAGTRPLRFALHYRG